MIARLPVSELPGALVLSLDFELHWGLRGNGDDPAAIRARVLGARRVVPMLLELFEEYGVAATWATVGMLFARDHAELLRHSPAVRPSYDDPRLDAYREEVGEDESTDPLHYGAELIERIRRTPRQEIATHTFSHYYCNEPGQDARAFACDLAAARSIAKTRDVPIRSIVFPRNQHNPDYDPLLIDAGIVAYRGVPDSWAWRFRTARESAGPLKRAARLLDSYVNVGITSPLPWSRVAQPNGLANVAATTMLRPLTPRLRVFEPLRLRRITGAMTAAARQRRIFHIWWHPHNFGARPEENVAFVRAALRHFAKLRTTYGMQSLGMAEVAELAGCWPERER